jgi:peptidoglycan/LPS O-acetylase OafA/YrhL
MADASGTKGRLHYLDSMRGLAALYVVFFHAYFVPIPQPQIASTSFLHFVKFGGSGVFLFFIISGFSLSLTFGRHERTPAPVISYGVSRFFRIAPLFYFVTIITLIYRFVAMGKPPALWTILVNLTFLFNLFPNHVQWGIASASWTIGVEMLFYAAFIPLVKSPIRVQAVALVASVVAFSVLCNFVTFDYARFSFIGYFPMFILGMWSFELLEKLRPAKHAGMIGIALMIAGVATLGAEAATRDPVLNFVLRIPIAVSYCAVLIGAGLATPAALELPALRYAGKTGFSLYLLHPLLIMSLNGPLQTIIARAGYTGLVVTIFVILIPLAYLTYRLIELPGERVGKDVFATLLRRRDRKAPAPVSAS